MQEYGAAHRVLLRTLMARGVVPLTDAERLLREITGAAPSVKDYVKDINEKIRPFQQNVKMATDEMTNEESLVFLSLSFDDISKAQTLFSQAELQYFRVLLEQILTTDQRKVSAIAALNLVNTLKTSLSKHDAEKLLQKWCEMRYLEQSDDCYVLGLRSVHEFEGYIRRNMPDVLEDCTLCKLVVFKGCNCPACGAAVHGRCLQRYLARLSRWPCCEEAYAGLPDPADVTHRQRDLSQDLSQDETAQTSQVYEPEQSQDDSGLTQASQLGISQSSDVRKRKRQW